MAATRHATSSVHSHTASARSSGGIKACIFQLPGPALRTMRLVSRIRSDSARHAQRPRDHVFRRDVRGPGRRLCGRPRARCPPASGQAPTGGAHCACLPCDNRMCDVADSFDHVRNGYIWIRCMQGSIDLIQNDPELVVGSNAHWPVHER